MSTLRCFLIHTRVATWPRKAPPSSAAPQGRQLGGCPGRDPRGREQCHPGAGRHRQPARRRLPGRGSHRPHSRVSLFANNAGTIAPRVARQRRQGHQVGPLAWFGRGADRRADGAGGLGRWAAADPVTGYWSPRPAAGRLRAVFSCDDPPVRCGQPAGPPVAVLLTLIQACDLAFVIEVDLGASR